MSADAILLGKGVFSIGDVPIGLTRGGGSFTLEREIRQIAADGDRGPVKGRIKVDRSIPKLTLNALETISENIPKMYAAISATSDGTKTTVTGTSKISLNDYNTSVKFTGETKAGKEVVIEVLDAINLENLNWNFVDKDEVVSTITYTGTYEENSPKDYEPWKIEYVE